MSVTEYLEQDWESIKVDLSKIDSKTKSDNAQAVAKSLVKFIQSQ